MSKINYFLTFKLNGDNSINDEIESNDAEQYGIEFELAKRILLSNNEIEKNLTAIKMLKDLDDGEFINALTWPLIKSFEKNDDFKEFRRNRMNEIFEKELGGELIE